jgi:hypothetical protein
MFFPFHIFEEQGGKRWGWGYFSVYLNRQYKKLYYFRLCLHGNSNISALPAFHSEQNLKLCEKGKTGVPKQESYCLLFQLYLPYTWGTYCCMMTMMRLLFTMYLLWCVTSFPSLGLCWQTLFLGNSGESSFSRCVLHSGQLDVKGIHQGQYNARS